MIKLNLKENLKDEITKDCIEAGIVMAATGVVWGGYYLTSKFAPIVKEKLSIKREKEEKEE